MTEVLKHLLRYAEFRRTLFLNASGKDEYGRHRGNVLYGMTLSPKTGNIVQINPGAVYTPFGTRFYYESADNVVGQIDLDGVMRGGTPVMAAGNDANRPMAIGVFVRTHLLNASNMQGIEASSDISALDMFHAREVTWSQITCQPAIYMEPRTPIDLASSQPTPSRYPHIDTSQDTGMLAPGGGVSRRDGAVQWHEVLIGVIIIGVDSTGTPSRDVGAGAWSPGIVYVPMMNVWEAVADFIGADPLAGRHDGEATQGCEDSDPALNQTYSREEVTTATSYFPVVKSPKYGSPKAGDPTRYRRPNFLRDGSPIVEALRRLDYLLRLWMDRTGDQSLVSWVQDGVGAYVDPMAPLADIEAAFDGSTGAGNNSVITYGDPGANNTSLREGLVVHTPAATPEANTTTADSHALALAALNLAVRHILYDIFGFGKDGRAVIPRARLRDSANWVAGLVTGLAINEVPNAHFTAPAVLTGQLASHYLVEPTVYFMLGELARRTQEQGSKNLLKNPNLAHGTHTDWTLGAGATLAATFSTDLYTRRHFDLPINGYLEQVIDFVSDAALEDLAAEAIALSAAATILLVGANAVVISIEVLTTGGTVLSSATTPGLLTTVAKGAATFSLMTRFSARDTTARKIRIRFTATGGTMTLYTYGAWVGFGTPPRVCGFDTEAYTNVNRGGDTMRGDLSFASTYRPTNVPTPVNPGDGVPKSYVDSETPTKYSLLTSALSAWTPPANVTRVTAHLMGAGGGGSTGTHGPNGATTGGGGGGAGAAGEYVCVSIDVTPGVPISYSCGSRGRGGVVPVSRPPYGADGADGGNTSFGAYAAMGGVGGKYAGYPTPGYLNYRGAGPGTGGINIRPDGTTYVAGMPGGDGGDGGYASGAGVLAEPGSMVAGLMSMGPVGAAGADGGAGTDDGGGGGGGGTAGLPCLFVGTMTGGSLSYTGGGDGGDGGRNESPDVEATAGAAGGLGCGGGGGGGGKDENPGAAGGDGGAGFIILVY